ncbi:ABC transporter substrate-binding protein [Paenibacillus sp. DMB20]|uniref:ABC transporter substrate-binding protein n=1 Tax=Paenibacillus sp. DMB20 TaxID=1642570 RepID=UPI000627E70B|nr:extracellular solute-binding protein [Paenibacillus sp. DMB20]KKO52415.1 sugar ABC transporter substrate-binding protein [Paenibacillus sp. DMB20]
MVKCRFVSCLIICIALFVSGCSAGSPNPDSKTLTLWYWNRSLDDNLIKAVEKEFPGIRIQAQKIGGDFKSKLKTTLAAGKGGPDIVAFNDWVAELFTSSDRFYDLYELGAKEIEKDYLDWKWQLGVTPEGKMIAMPIDTGPTALFYRADLFEQAGLPSDPEEVHRQLATWEDYLNAGIKLNEAFGGKVKLTDNITNVYNQVNSQSGHIYFSKDGSFIGEDTSSSMKTAWNTAVKASHMELLANAGSFSSEWNAAMNNGRIASFVGAVWAKEILMDAAPDTAGKWRVTRAPGGDGNNGGSFLAIMKTSRYPEESFEVMKWLLNPENQAKSYETINLFPSASGALESPAMLRKDPFFGNQPTGEIFTASARHVKSAYFGGKFANLNGIAGRQLQSVALEGKDPDTAWEDAIKRIKRELLR